MSKKQGKIVLKGKKVLVTGAGGFIGSHLVEALLNKRASVRAFVKYNSRSDWGMLSDLPIESRKSIDVIFGEIQDPFFVRKAVEDCDIVFHLAALIGIPYSYVAPIDYVTVNILGTVNILQACKDHRTPHIIHTSTSEVYGTALYIPIDEKHPLQGQSPYSASKIGADKMVESYYNSFGLPVVTVRPFNTFGPRQSSRAFIPTVISQALNSKKISMGSLEPIRDMTFVKDTVEGLITAGLCGRLVGQVVNLGTGRGQTIGTMTQIILRLLGKENLSIERDETRVRPAKSEVMRLVSDNTKARDICGWNPRYNFEEGLVETIEWCKKNMHRYHPDDYTI